MSIGINEHGWTLPAHVKIEEGYYKIHAHDARPLLKWSNEKDPPKVFDKVTAGRLGTGEVVGYFDQSGWLGILFKPDVTPEWWYNKTRAHLFGAEVSY